MSQTSLDDEELFGEAASEMREDVETSIEAAWMALPDADDVWNVEAENVLGALNGLKSSLDAGDAETHLRDAKKWFTMGQRAEAFEDPDSLEDEIAAVSEVIDDLESAREQVGELTATIPALKATLESAAETTENGEDEENEETPATAEADD